MFPDNQTFDKRYDRLQFDTDCQPALSEIYKAPFLPTSKQIQSCWLCEIKICFLIYVRRIKTGKFKFTGINSQIYPEVTVC